MIRRQGVLAAENLLRAILVFLLQTHGFFIFFADQTACQMATYHLPCMSIYRTFEILTTINNEQ